MKYHLSLFLAFSLPLCHAQADNRTDNGLFTSDRSAAALSHAVGGLDDDALDLFVLGRSFFTIPWVEAPSATTARDGLGPLFNANSCASCHANNGGGVSSTLEEGPLHRSITLLLASGSPERDNGNVRRTGFTPDPVYGSQLAINGNHDVPFEGRVSVRIDTRRFVYPDGRQVDLKRPLFHLQQLNYGPLGEETRVHPRRAPMLLGLGLIERIPDSQILAKADELDQDKDGISGRPNRVWSLERERLELGRYGWKASKVSVIEQTANALINDLGLTNPWFPGENCTKHQAACRRAYRSREPDIPMQRMRAIGHYLTNLKIPLGTTANNRRGAGLFREIGCQGCHRTGYTTDDGVQVDPYSDFLLHDMGAELADQSRIFDAGPAEWRTPPLWGLGLSKKLNSSAGYLHDGRATTPEEAILWHGGEAEAARNKFVHLPEKDRAALLSFLDTL